MKNCITCKLNIPNSQFFRDKTRKDGLVSECKSCRKKYGRKHYLKNREKYIENQKQYQSINKEKYIRYRNEYWLKRKYKITLDEYHSLFEKQNKCCVICKRVEVNRRMPVDHNHKTGKVRGILCSFCNRALGLMRDDVHLLREAIKYLNKNA